MARAPGVVLFDLDEGGQERLLGIPVRQTSDLRISPDGRILAVSSYESSAMILWDIHAGRVWLDIQGDSSGAIAMAIASDGRSLTTLSPTAVLHWDLATGRPRHIQAGPGNHTHPHAFTPDGRLLAMVEPADNSIRIWDIQSGGQARMIPGRSPPVNSLAFSPDGRLLATADMHGFASLFSVATSGELRRLDGQAQYLRNVNFSPDGRTLAATGNDGDIRPWDLDGPIALKADPRTESFARRRSGVPSTAGTNR